MAIVSATEQIGIGATTTIGGSLDANTGLNAVPADAGSFSASESYENILDTGRRGGSEAMDFYAYQGVGLSEISFDFPMMYWSDYRYSPMKHTWYWCKLRIRYCNCSYSWSTGRCCSSYRNLF